MTFIHCYFVKVRTRQRNLQTEDTFKTLDRLNFRPLPSKANGRSFCPMSNRLRRGLLRQRTQQHANKPSDIQSRFRGSNGELHCGPIRPRFWRLGSRLGKSVTLSTQNGARRFCASRPSSSRSRTGETTETGALKGCLRCLQPSRPRDGLGAAASGGRMGQTGWKAVRVYWTRQWGLIDPQARTARLRRAGSRLCGG